MPNRFYDLTSGIAMLVTDLHGDWDAYQRHVTRFRRLHAQGKVNRLILLGDLIHSDGAATNDHSLRMVLDVIKLRAELGPDTVIMLLGNHEMPHIYGVTLAKGDIEYTPRFEHALGDHRATVIDFFMELPFFVRTAAGVMLAHAGPAPTVIDRIRELYTFDHHTILNEADSVLREAEDMESLYTQFGAMYGAAYAELVYSYLAVSDPRDPRYPYMLRSFMISQQSRRFDLLWDTLFSRNEFGLSEEVYLNACQQFMAACSVDAPAPQRVIVSGHIGIQGGHMMVNRQHLRLASAAHAHPRESGQYLLLDCARPVESALSLQPYLNTVFEDL